MGNHVSFGASHVRGKIVFCDGSVQEFDEPLTAAELMLEHPQQVVVEMDSAMKERRPTPLPADKKLEMRKMYVMLPVKRGKAVGLSGEECRRIVMMVNYSATLHCKYNDLAVCSPRLLPWIARLWRNNEMLQRKEENMAGNNIEQLVPEIIEDRPEYYLSRQMSGKGWKPSLDTIKEKNKINTKLSRWFFIKSF
ncbi:hypothetical protein HN51_039333 [Arachis hypogaea]|uniref:Uncharacterized protein n=2 Tax=Arachis hypogaea TaxID=3818 RepID=A0A444YIM7_ARAHY|nr:uncharacterized protein LOC107648050 [Arachis ipaensis]XP_025662303.1 uncharacterized protein LOC112757973 [Arachis hypogaea]QHN84836.1 uncharacterized protein DS421_16g532170 [Arachis hypogaea]RYR01796.1 hypothetical protein Ahy_B06g080666 isoform A [Arachis hypogaea]